MAKLLCIWMRNARTEYCDKTNNETFLNIKRMILKQGDLLLEDEKVNESVWPFQTGSRVTAKAIVVDDLGPLQYLISHQNVSFLFHDTIKKTLSLFLNFKTTQRWNWERENTKEIFIFSFYVCFKCKDSILRRFYLEKQIYMQTWVPCWAGRELEARRKEG